MTPTKKLFGAAALGALLVTACHNDELFRPQFTQPVDPLFTRYVSLGNSITAGFQSGGINDSTQRLAYPVLLARQMHSQFFVPLMKRPGCPAPYTNVFTGAVVGPPVPGGCALRLSQDPPYPYLNNLAVPQAAVEDVLSNLSANTSANALTTFFLGGRTQAEMMQRTDPTFVTAWIGNNDVLGAVLSATNAGDSTLITPVAAFQTSYTAMADAIAQTNAQGAVLIGVANVTAIPYLSSGQTYFAIKAGMVPGVAFPPTFTVGPNCAPSAFGGKGDSVLVPFPFGLALLGPAFAGAPTTLSCTEPQTVQPAELAKLVTTVTAYNAFIQSQVTAHGWVYFDPNTALDSLRAIPTAVAPFPNAGAPPAFNPCSASPFGTAFSCDGVHPSAATQRLVANKLIEVINAKYGTSLAKLP
jgi:lysophospholipase L1-like esterase